VRGEAFNRKRAEDAKKSGAEKKFETRNPKFETISNDQKSKCSKQARFGFRKRIRTWR
jgi:hypothetical protein